MPMVPAWHMGYIDWAEIVFFGSVLAITIILLMRCRLSDFREPVTQVSITPATTARRWTQIPEIQLCMFALPLELLWEVAQFPLYSVWHEGDWSYILYGLAHCTLGDLLILLSVFWVLALMNRSRYWYCANHPLPNSFLFTLLGLGYTVFSEIWNVRVKGTWGYTELMPLIPVLDVGGMPFMQWLLIPPVLLWLMRLFSGLQMPVISEPGKSTADT